MSNHYILSVFEDLASMLSNAENLTNFKLMRVARKALTTAGMEPSYRDQMVARMDFSIGAELDEEELQRLENVTSEIVYKFYSLFKSEGYNDQAIALMGSQIQLSMS